MCERFHGSANPARRPGTFPVHEAFPSAEALVESPVYWMTTWIVLVAAVVLSLVV
jgi:hypothetical protein